MIIFWRTIRAQWPVWLLLLLSLYVAFACEFHCLRLISLPLPANQIEKLNDLAKSVALSYVAGMIFYTLSEMLPFLRKSVYVQEKLRAMNRNLSKAIDDFLTSLCGKCDESNEQELFFLSTGGAYEKDTDYFLRKSKLLAFRKLSVNINEQMAAMQACDVYLEMDDYKTLLKLRSKSYVALLNEIAQSTGERHLKSQDMMEVLKGVVEMKNKLLGMHLMK